jgi:hypothetical protein
MENEEVLIRVDRRLSAAEDVFLDFFIILSVCLLGIGNASGQDPALRSPELNEAIRGLAGSRSE